MKIGNGPSTCSYYPNFKIFNWASVMLTQLVFSLLLNHNAFELRKPEIYQIFLLHYSLAKYNRL